LQFFLSDLSIEQTKTQEEIKMHLVITAGTIDKLFDLGFTSIGITPYEGIVAVNARVESLNPNQIKALADIPGLLYLTNTGVDGHMRLVFSGDAVEEMEG
jgi:hypothetical protein